MHEEHSTAAALYKLEHKEHFEKLQTTDKELLEQMRSPWGEPLPNPPPGFESLGPFGAIKSTIFGQSAAVGEEVVPDNHQPTPCKRAQAYTKSSRLKQGEEGRVGPMSPAAMQDGAHAVHGNQHGRAHEVMPQGIRSHHATPKARLVVLTISL